jgi:tRNA threonylcarbamoyladenosine biosynthesis protein TsaE
VEARKPKRTEPAAGEASTEGKPGKSRSRTVFTLSEEETEELGAAIARGLRGSELLLLSGDLGLGKTVLARGVASGLGIAREDVSSPSFSLVQEYRGGRMSMFHVDLYRLADGEDLESLGLDEILAGDAVTVVEWGEKLPAYYRRDAIRVRLFDMGEGSRRIEIDDASVEPPPRRGDA